MVYWVIVDQAMEQGRDVLLDIEIQGAAQVREKRPDVVRIYVAPPRRLPTYSACSKKSPAAIHSSNFSRVRK